MCIYLCGRFRSGKTGRAAVLSLYRYPESGIDAGLRDPWGILSGIFGTVRTERRGILPAAETFLLHFSGDLYEQPCRVELLHFLRDEQKFPDVDSLYRQIAQDQKQCQEWLKQHDL